MLINEYLANSRNTQENEEDKPIMADNTEFHSIKSKHHPRIRNMLRCHEAMRNGRLSDIKVVERAIDLKKDSKPFMSARTDRVQPPVNLNR